MHGASVTVAQLPNTSKIAKVAENYSLQKMLVRLKIAKVTENLLKITACQKLLVGENFKYPQ